MSVAKPRRSGSGFTSPTSLSPRRQPSYTGMSDPPKTARTSLIDVLSRPRPVTSISTHTVSSSTDGSSSNPDDDFSDQSTISSYASSITSAGSSRNPSSEELAKVFKNYLEKPFVVTKTAIKHSEFGHCNNPNWRWTSQWNPEEPIHAGEQLQPPMWVLLTTYLSYIILIILGHTRDFLGKRFFPQAYYHLMPHGGYAALNSDFDSFYTRRLKKRLDDCFSRPVTAVPGRSIVCLDRTSKDDMETFQFTGGHTRALNVSSYNYLGFASSTGGCADAVEASIKRYGVAAGGNRHDGSTLDLHVQCEKLVARFVGQEASLITSMGFATNSANIPALVGKGCLVISDEFNHASIRFGVRLSGASVRSFKHNDMKALEILLRESISQGQPRTHRPWRKILVVVEGLYSMEGSLVPLPQLLELKKRYKFYLYLDEAHSIGAIGPNGRGVCDYFGIDPREVDILMGTFTKSFGASGGYIAGSKLLIDRLRVRSQANCYCESMSPPVLTQIIASMSSIMGVSPPLALATEDIGDGTVTSTRVSVPGPAPASLLPTWLSLPPNLLNGTEGRERLRRIAFNTRYLSSGLRKLGFIVYGHRDSPIIPLLIYQPAKMRAFSHLMMYRFGADKTPISVVVVAYPATPLIESRVRFCLSASHTKNDMDMILRACDEVGDVLQMKYGTQTMKVEDIIASAEELVASNF